MWTLKELGRRRMYRAERGQHGRGSGKHGRRGQPLMILVPIGTEVSIVSDDGGLWRGADLVGTGQKVVVARGGKGGWGNARFATSTNRAPRIAQRGQRGEEVKLVLDLKLLADVGLVGVPNAGKSTLLRAISAARPKVGEYPFTTLEPVLGVVENGWRRFVVADIPGLIEGAHKGAGLGLDFLRHIERTRVILHVVDGSSAEPWNDVQTVNAELREYGSELHERRHLIAVNKIDIPTVRDRTVELRALFAGHGEEPVFISAATGEGVSELVLKMAGVLGEEKPEETAPLGETVLRPEASRPAVQVHCEDGAYRIEGDRVVAFVEMMPVHEDEGLAELWRRFGRWGITSALRRAGAKPGDRIRVGRVELEWLG